MKTRRGNRRIAIDINEVSNNLFPYHDDPFASDDTWSGLADSYREAWTAGNQVVPQNVSGMRVLEEAQRIRHTNILVHVDIQIVASSHLINQDMKATIKKYAKVMRAGLNGTTVNFDVSFAHESLYKRLAMHSRSQHPFEFMGILEQAAVTSGLLNAMYIIVNHGNDPITNFTPNKPFLGQGRVSWYLYQIPTDKPLNIANLLTTTETIAQRVFAPIPLYHPIPFLREFTVDVSAYTPGHELRALWLEKFEWEEFESLSRNYAIHGQKVRFHSMQTNAECASCSRAFRNAGSSGFDFIDKAALILNNEVVPNKNWTKGFQISHVKTRVQPNTFRLFVFDTTNLKRTEKLSRLERKSLFLFPGMSILIFRSSDKKQLSILDSLMIRAVVGGVYGIAEPDLYVLSGDQSDQGQGALHMSAILIDVMVRSFVRSIVEVRLSELVEIVDGILHFDVDPSKALNNRDYRSFTQRINLLLHKLKKAQRILSAPSERGQAVYLAASTIHDIRAIRTVFNLQDNSKAYERFKDPTVRCHFSRLKRQALRASGILESTYSIAGLFLRALVISVGSALITFYSLRRLSPMLRGKRE